MSALSATTCATYRTRSHRTWEREETDVESASFLRNTLAAMPLVANSPLRKEQAFPITNAAVRSLASMHRMHLCMRTPTQ